MKTFLFFLALAGVVFLVVEFWRPARHRQRAKGISGVSATESPDDVLANWKLHETKVSVPAASTTYTDLQAVGFVEGEGAFDYEIVGESHCQAALERIAGARGSDGKNYRCVAKVIREPGNAYDPSACVVTIDGLKVGYIPKADNRRLITEKSEAGFPFVVDALIVGGWSNSTSEGSYGVRLDLDPAGIPATAIQKDMVRYVLGKLPRGLSQSMAKRMAGEWDAELTPRYTAWQCLQEVIEHLQSVEGREEFDIKKPSKSAIQAAFQSLVDEGRDPEDLASDMGEVVDRIAIQQTMEKK